jgi:hypothetical protein
MRLTSICAARGTLVRFLSASVVRLALGATLTTPLSPTACQTLGGTSARFEPTICSAAQDEAPKTPAPSGRKTSVSGRIDAEPAAGWG